MTKITGKEHFLRRIANNSTSQPGPEPDRVELEIGLYLEENAPWLLGRLHYYVQQARLGQGETACEIAQELLSELTLEVLENAGRFDPQRPLQPWVLGIAVNLVKRRQASQQRQSYREPLASDLQTGSASESSMTDERLFDWLEGLAIDEGPEKRWIINEAASHILQLLAETDREIIRLAVVVGLNGDDLAQHLSITPMAARVRLHRALQRLKKAWQAASHGAESNSEPEFRDQKQRPRQQQEEETL